MDYVALKKYIEAAIPWITASGLTAELLEDRHVVLRLPRDRHLNHLGIVYAGSLFMLMEVAGAALLACTYPLGRYIPITREMHVKFLRMGTTDITCDLSISEAQAAAMILPIDEKGRGEWVLEMDCRDANGKVVSSSVCHYYVRKVD